MSLYFASEQQAACGRREDHAHEFGNGLLITVKMKVIVEGCSQQHIYPPDKSAGVKESKKFNGKYSIIS